MKIAPPMTRMIRYGILRGRGAGATGGGSLSFAFGGIIGGTTVIHSVCGV